MRSRGEWLVGGLLLAGLVVAAKPAAAHPGPDIIHAVLLFHHRAAEIADAPTLEALRRGDPLDEDLAAAWVWTRSQPPRRIEPERLRRELTARSQSSARVPAPNLRVEVPTNVNLPQNLEVLAAPAEMYRQVPEAWLPRFRLTKDGTTSVPVLSATAWRLRLVGAGRGTGWQEVRAGSRTATLSPIAAGSVHVVVASASGGPVDGAFLTILQDLEGSTRPDVLSQHRMGDDGAIEIPSLPADLLLTFVAGAPGHASRTFRARPTDLPATLRLPRGARLHGRLVDADGQPLAETHLSAEGWLADEIPVRFYRSADSADDGKWEITSLPPRPLVLVAHHSGSAPWRRAFEPREGADLDIGDVVLAAGAALSVAVVDDAGAPVPQARLSVQGLPTVVTDDQGKGVLEDLPSGSDVTLTALADDHLTEETVVSSPWPRLAEIRLARAFIARGQFLDTDLMPLPGSTVRVERGDSFYFADVTPQGDFRLELQPDSPYTLRFSSPTTSRRVVELARGAPGEQRDLGTVTPPPGVAVWGTVVSAVDGLPVVGARVWLPRPSPDLLGAWLHGDLIETRSDELGRFHLGGLDGKSELLRIDAPGFARQHLAVQPEPGQAEVDAGEIELAPGASLRVRTSDEDATSHAVARLDLRRRWMDLDMISAPVIDGWAEIPHAPPGEALLTVLADGELVCEKEIVVSPDDDELEVSCATEGPSVHGVVLVGDRPAGSGNLVWTAQDGAQVMATVLNLRSPLGARQQRTVGRGRPPVEVAVADDGSFVSSHLAAGRWNVVWYPETGTPTSPQVVDVPEGDEPAVVVRIAGGVVSGRVTDAHGAPVEGAWVHDVDGRGISRTRADGSFELSGLTPGTVRLQARNGALFSDVVEVALDERRGADPVDLTLLSDHRGRLSVQVWTPAETPASGAFVFLDADGRGLQVVSTDGRGNAEITLSAPYPPRVRLAAQHAGLWTFGPWRSWHEVTEGTELRIRDYGQLLVTTDETTEASVPVVGPDGWDVSALLSLLGMPASVSPDQPLLLSGLPQGHYQVGRRSASVEADHQVRVSLD